MNRKQEILIEIESKLAKDDYASKLPTYHPAKGRRKKWLQNKYKPTDNSFSHGQKERPDDPPEIENPDQEEINPERDFPGREIHKPQEEELPSRNPNPEIQNPDEEEFG